MADIDITDTFLKLLTDFEEYNQGPKVKKEQLLKYLKVVKWLLKSSSDSDKMCNLSAVIVELENLTLEEKIGNDNNNNPVEESSNMLIVSSTKIDVILTKTNIVEHCILALKIVIEYLINRICNNFSIDDFTDIQKTALELIDCLSVFEKHRLFQPHTIDIESLIGSLINKLLDILICITWEMLPLKVHIYHMVNVYLANLAKTNHKYDMLVLRNISENLSNFVSQLEEIDVGKGGVFMVSLAYFLRILKKILSSHISPDYYENDEFLAVLESIRNNLKICEESQRFSQFLRAYLNRMINCCDNKFLKHRPIINNY